MRFCLWGLDNNDWVPMIVGGRWSRLLGGGELESYCDQNMIKDSGISVCHGCDHEELEEMRDLECGFQSVSSAFG